MNAELLVKLSTYLDSFSTEPLHLIGQNMEKGDITISHILSGATVQGYYEFPLNVNNTVMSIDDVIKNRKVMKKILEYVKDNAPASRTVFMQFKGNRKIKVQVYSLTKKVLFEGYFVLYSYKYQGLRKMLFKSKHYQKYVAKTMSRKLKRLDLN